MPQTPLPSSRSSQVDNSEALIVSPTRSDSSPFPGMRAGETPIAVHDRRAATGQQTTGDDPRTSLRAWLRGGSYGPTELSRRGCILVIASVLAVAVPVVSLTLLSVDAHVALKVWVLAITVIALVGALLRVVADTGSNQRGDLDRAGKAVGAVAALFTALAVIIDWSLLHL